MRVGSTVRSLGRRGLLEKSFILREKTLSGLYRGIGTESHDDMCPPYWITVKEGVLYGNFVIVGMIT